MIILTYSLQLEQTRVRFFFRIFTHITRNDPLLQRLSENVEDDPDARRASEDVFEPLNQNGEIDESFNPLTPRELSILSQEKADKNLTDEVCSICCDNFEEKQKIRN